MRAMIPVDLRHCPSPRKPGKRGTEEQWQEWKDASQRARISAEGARRIGALRDDLDRQGQRHRPLLLSADGTFTCREIFKHLPARVELIGRIRKDARLYMLPRPEQENHGRGRRRAYGDRLPTPEQLRQDERLPWRAVRAHAAGKEHTFHVKEITPCRWKHAGGDRTLRLLIVRPLGYRLRKRAPMNYRAPAYLITTTRKRRWNKSSRPTCGAGKSKSTSATRRRFWASANHKSAPAEASKPSPRSSPPSTPCFFSPSNRPAESREPSPPPNGNGPIPKNTSVPPPAKHSENCEPKSGAKPSAWRIKTASSTRLTKPRNRQRSKTAPQRPSATHQDSQTREAPGVILRGFSFLCQLTGM
ncbi:MAG: hypothetical protein HC888_07040 [Candidatus Competibacteraceae bacterium]|nr:hypothetical protein [Candidatus Competibacteraceae bacterium]